MKPFVRPMIFGQLFFTYILPMIPLCYAWCEQASLPRIYMENYLKQMTTELNTDIYQ